MQPVRLHPPVWVSGIAPETPGSQDQCSTIELCPAHWFSVTNDLSLIRARYHCTTPQQGIRMGGWGSNPCLAVSGPIHTYVQIHLFSFKGTKLRLYRHQIDVEFQVVPYGHRGASPCQAGTISRRWFHLFPRRMLLISAWETPNIPPIAMLVSPCAIIKRTVSTSSADSLAFRFLSPVCGKITNLPFE